MVNSCGFSPLRDSQRRRDGHVVLSHRERAKERGGAGHYIIILGYLPHCEAHTRLVPT